MGHSDPTRQLRQPMISETESTESEDSLHSYRKERLGMNPAPRMTGVITAIQEHPGRRRQPTESSESEDGFATYPPYGHTYGTGDERFSAGDFTSASEEEEEEESEIDEHYTHPSVAVRSVKAIGMGFVVDEEDYDEAAWNYDAIDSSWNYETDEDPHAVSDVPITPYEAQLLSLSTNHIRTARVNTMYKTKDKKVRPVDLGVSDGSKPGGIHNWKDVIKSSERHVGPIEPFDHLITGRFSSLEQPLAKGSRLTPERIANIVMGDFLLPRERELLIAILFNREAALAYDFPHCGVVSPLVAPPQEIRVVEHTAWQCRPFPIPKALNDTVAGMLQDRIRSGALEQCHGPYRNPWFLVKKGGGKYRLINAAMEMNRVTIRDANLPPATDEFAEEFAGNKVASLIDWFSGYDQVPLDVKSRDLTAFFTPLGLLRMTRLPQGATNSVAQFVRVVSKVLEDQIPHRAIPFLDDVGVKGPTSTYNDEELEPGLRRYMVEHLQNLDATLCDLERAGCTIGPKSQFCMDGIKMVGYICDGEGRRPDSLKIIKVTEWPPCRDKRDIKAFLGLCVYYRIWIENFSEMTEPLYSLLRKDVDWKWTTKQDLAMDHIKLALTSAPALVKVDYSENKGEIILAVDASLTGWGAVLMQVDAEGRRHPSRYESGLWNPAEQQYDATKRECRGVLKALKKVRNYLYGIHFILETDAKVLVSQLNLAAADLPGALVTRWLAWIRLFDFDVRHVAGTKHGAPDALSRRPRTAQDEIEEAHEVDIDDFIEAELNCVHVDGMFVNVRTSTAILEDSSDHSDHMSVTGDGATGDGTAGEPFLEGNWTEESHEIANFLKTLKRPEGLDRKELRSFKSKALRFLVKDQTLFRRNTKNTPQRRVVDDISQRAEIIQSLHDDLGHKGREATYRKVADRYWWERCYRDVQNYCSSCTECQLRSTARVEEPMFATWTNATWEKVGVDIVHMQPVQGKTYLVVARDDFSGWVEARPLARATSKAVAKFLWEDVVCRHGVFGRLIVDGGPENKGLVTEFARRYGIKRVMVSAYHPQANGMVERGHKPIVDALSKMSSGGLGNWVDNLPAVLLADRVTVRASTGQSPYYLNHGNQPVLPIELRYPTWRILDFCDVTSTADLLRIRAQQFLRRDKDLEEATNKLRRSRIENGAIFDEKKRLRSEPLQKGDYVLLHDAVREVDMSRVKKLDYRWRGPYQIMDLLNSKGSFTLAELDGTRLAGTFAGNRLKRFIKREDHLIPIPSDDETEPSEGSYETEGSEGSEDSRNTEERWEEGREREQATFRDDETVIEDLGAFLQHTPAQRKRFHEIMARDCQRALNDGENPCGPDGLRYGPNSNPSRELQDRTALANRVKNHRRLANTRPHELYGEEDPNVQQRERASETPYRRARRDRANERQRLSNQRMQPTTRQETARQEATQHIPEGRKFAVVLQSELEHKRALTKLRKRVDDFGDWFSDAFGSNHQEQLDEWEKERRERMRSNLHPPEECGSATIEAENEDWPSDGSGASTRDPRDESAIERHERTSERKDLHTLEEGRSAAYQAKKGAKEEEMQTMSHRAQEW